MIRNKYGQVLNFNNNFLQFSFFVSFLLTSLCGSFGNAVAQIKTQKDTTQVNVWIERSLDYRINGAMDSANYCSQKALKISKRINYKYGEGKSLYYIGIVAYVRGNYIAAIDTMTRASELFKASGNKKDYSSVLTVIGGVKNAMGDLIGALEYQLKALKIKESIGDSANLAAAYNNIGNVYLSIEENQKALSYFQRALKLNTKFKNNDKIPDNYYSIASVYHLLHNYSQALLNTNISIHLADSLGLIETLSYSYGLMASLKMDKGELDSAEDYCLKAITISEKLDDKRMISALSQRLGTIYQNMGKVKKAELYLLRALKISESINYLEESIEVQLKLSELYEKNGDYKKALFFYKKFRDGENTLIDSEKEKEMTKKEMIYEFDKKLALDKLEQDKKDSIALEKSKNQKMIIYSISAGLFFVLIFTLFIFKSYRQKQKANKIIVQQKIEVEHQKYIIEEKHKEILDSIHYAKRIQDSLLTPQKYIERNIKRLKNNRIINN